MSKQPSKRRRINAPKSNDVSVDQLAKSSDVAVDQLADAMTNRVLQNLQASGIFPSTSRTGVDQSDSVQPSDNTPEQQDSSNIGRILHEVNVLPPNIVQQSNSVDIGQQPAIDTNSVNIPAQNVNSNFFSQNNNTYKPLGRPLYSKINLKLQEKIKNNEFIEMSDILVDHHPNDIDLHLAVKNQRVGLTSGKKRKFLTIENWTDAFSIFASVIRKNNPLHHTISEDLAIYMDLIRQIHKDGGDWFFL